MSNKDSFGDRIKAYEAVESHRRFLPLLPVYARIDGRSFSEFTRGLDRPYDVELSNIMRETTRWLVEETGACMGYTQSDEISLVWYSNNTQTQIFFNGRVTKMTSTLAAMASVKFNYLCLNSVDKIAKRARSKLPTFDARVFQLPNLVEAANTFLWREQDATKNAISMAAHAFFSHSQLQGKTGAEKQEMLWQTHGINFNDYPAFFKRGSWFARRKFSRELTVEELERIPEKHRPTGPILRTSVVEVEMPKFTSVTNRVGVIFNGEDPEIKNPIEG